MLCFGKRSLLVSRSTISRNERGWHNQHGCPQAARVDRSSEIGICLRQIPIGGVSWTYVQPPMSPNAFPCSATRPWTPQPAMLSVSSSLLPSTVRCIALCMVMWGPVVAVLTAPTEQFETRKAYKRYWHLIYTTNAMHVGEHWTDQLRTTG